MIKAIVPAKDPQKKDALILGLSELNLQRLKEGKPIHFDLEHISHQIVIMYGKTEADIAKQLGIPEGVTEINNAKM